LKKKERKKKKKVSVHKQVLATISKEGSFFHISNSNNNTYMEREQSKSYRTVRRRRLHTDKESDSQATVE
tara:strand:+ start:2735 stop:2944 length:210 start_codon:yes stop_codon:yes gene_type:complete